MKEVLIVEHDESFKETWYYSGEIIQVEDFDVSPDFYKQIGTSNIIDKKHCFVLSEV